MRVLVVYAHPLADSFVAHVRDRAVAALASAGHDVDLCDLYGEGFDPCLSLAERQAHRDPASSKPAIAGYASRLKQTDALVFVYPTWWGGLPAMLKGWIDRVWVEGVAYTLPASSNRVRAGLRNIKRFVIVTTHGSSKFVNLLEGEPGRHQLRRTLRVLCHPVMRTRWVAMYGIDSATEAQRRQFVARVERVLQQI